MEQLSNSTLFTTDAQHSALITEAADLPLPFTLTHEQDPEILKLLHLGQTLGLHLEEPTLRQPGRNL